MNRYVWSINVDYFVGWACVFELTSKYTTYCCIDIYSNRSLYLAEENF